jgi:glutamyl/glutaminyl-tRNA synthetase
MLRAMIRTRFAPSPNGLLHLGHAYAAIVAHDLAHAPRPMAAANSCCG